MEYGPGPDEYYPIHLEILCCYSTIIAQASKLAEPLKHKYAEVSKLRKDLEEIVMEDIVSETCSAERANHAMQIVHTCLKEFPLEERQLAIQKSLTHFSEFLFSDPKKLNTGSMAMMKKPEFRNWDLCHRVKLLNSGGAMLLSRRLLKALRNVDDLEKKNAAKSNITAVAQGRIILHGEDSRVVRSVAAWIYDKQMQYIDARHLLKLFSLAEHMGLLDLAQNCLRLLSSSASACLERASTHGVSLYELLRSSTNGLTAAQDADDALRHVVSDIYVFVLSSHRPPKALENIVVETLVAETDSKVFDMFGAKIERRLMRLLIQALYKRQASIKTDYAPSETGYHTEQFVGVADENSLFIPSA